MGRIFASFLVLMLGQTGIAYGQDGYAPPPVGTQITWSERGTDGNSQTRVSKVIANGDDFAIYLFDLNWDETEPVSYFAEFSGLHIVPCLAEMPSADERAQLSGLWPFETGRDLQIGEDQPVTYSVGGEAEHVIASSEEVRPAQIVTSTEGTVEIDTTLSIDFGMPIRQVWKDGLVTSAIDIFIPQGSAGGDEEVELGECAALLD